MNYSFILKRNIHMYNHLIVYEYKNKRYQAICESAPTKEETILFWPDDFKVPDSEKEIMLKHLEEWLQTQPFKYKILLGKGR